MSTQTLTNVTLTVNETASPFGAGYTPRQRSEAEIDLRDRIYEMLSDGSTPQEIRDIICAEYPGIDTAELNELIRDQEEQIEFATDVRVDDRTYDDDGEQERIEMDRMNGREE